MEKIREKIAGIITHTHKTPLEQADEILLLFSVSNSALIVACKTVVDGYEGDGMENMKNRDDVFYRECKSALEHCY